MNNVEQRNYSSPEMSAVLITAEKGFSQSFTIDRWEDGTVIEDEC